VPGSPYVITPSAAVGTGLGNYTIGYVTGTLTVNRAVLTITAGDWSKTYGETVVFDATTPSTDFTVVGLLNSDTVTGVALASTGAAAGATVAGSPHGITPSAAVGTGLGNYAIGYVTGTLTVNPATLTITAQPKSKAFGSADPPLTYIVSGLQSGDTEAGVLTGALTRATGEAVGSYPITQGGLAANSNYTINFTGSTLTINSAAPQILSLTVVSPSQVVVVWSAVSNVTYRVQARPDLNAGWVNLVPDVRATNTTAAAVDNPAGAPQRFYRILMLP
jgi:hypothetical protein